MNMDLTGLNRSVDAACDEIDRLRAQRDELLAALKVVTDMLADQRDYVLGNAYPEEYEAVVTARAAISRAEGNR